MDVSDGDGTCDCIGPIDTVLAAARGDRYVNQSPAELGARVVEALDIAYRSARSGQARAPGVMSGPPFAEDLVLDVPLPPAPGITIDTGLAAQYLGVSGDQLRLALSDDLSTAVTGRAQRMPIRARARPLDRAVDGRDRTGDRQPPVP